ELLPAARVGWPHPRKKLAARRVGRAYCCSPWRPPPPVSLAASSSVARHHDAPEDEVVRSYEGVVEVLAWWRCSHGGGARSLHRPHVMSVGHPFTTRMRQPHIIATPPQPGAGCEHHCSPIVSLTARQSQATLPAGYEHHRLLAASWLLADRNSTAPRP
ncbi:hypothetical protein Dimus_030521, partial [Dionaea muscipula]